MDKQRLLSSLDANDPRMSRDKWRTDTHDGRGALSGEEGSVSGAAMFRQHLEDTGTTEPVEDYQNNIQAPTKERLDKSRLDRRKETIILTSPTGTFAEPPQNRNSHADQPSRETMRIFDVPASESVERHQWSASNLGHAMDATIPCNNIAKHGPPITCPANVPFSEEWNMTMKYCDSSLPWETGANTGWRAPCNAFIPPDSYTSTDNLTGEPMPHSWFSPLWYTKTGLQTTFSEPFNGWNRSQSRDLIGCETNFFSPLPIPAQELVGWPSEGGAEESWYANRSGVMPICGAHSQEQYPLGPSFDLLELIPSSVAAGLSSIPETVPPSFPSFPGVQQVEETSLALPTESPMLPPPWDPLTTTAAEAHIADIRSRSLHQQPFVPMPIQNIESVVPPRLHNAMDFQETHVMPFVNVGANGQELSRDLTVPEDQVEHGRLT
ncbi:hypothetical protein CBS147353_11400 [Aspergillus niger]|nr:hypothetical protein CBS147353_11400 [Aspergillus niger]